MRLEYVDRRADALVQLVWAAPNPGAREDALAAARQADVVVMMLGLSPRLEGEEMPVRVPGFAGGDRVELGLPASQQELLQAVVAVGKPVVVVLLNGSALAIPWAAEHAPAILEAWYPGQAAGTAIADVLFGDVNPAGRLPVTFYRSVEQLPPFDDYAMRGRTYRYFDGEPLFPFGHGLSYTTFAYRDLSVPAELAAGDTVRVTVVVENTGDRAGEEVVQLYVTDDEASVPVPIRSLAAFQRVSLAPGESRMVSFAVAPRAFSVIHDAGGRMIEPGTFTVSVGGSQDGVTATVHVVGAATLTP
jgi:beta-glucosidase